MKRNDWKIKSLVRYIFPEHILAIVYYKAVQDFENLNQVTMHSMFLPIKWLNLTGKKKQKKRYMYYKRNKPVIYALESLNST